jgi:nucleoside-diphosphate-sugar epimerase
LFGKISPFYANKRILVTGASGYLATNLIRWLKEINCTVVRLSRSGRLSPINGHANIVDVTGDICARETCQQVLEDVDIVFHFGAQTSVYVANENPIADFQANVMPMLTLLETCRNKAVHPIIVFSGTATEVGIPESLPVNEACRDYPITIYDIHKLMAENYLKYYSRQGIVYGTTLRLTNVYGPGPKSSSSDRGVINIMIRRALAGEQLTVYGQGVYLRDYVYVEDVVFAFLKAAIHIAQLNGRHFVLGSSQGHTIADVINLVAERAALKTGHRVPVKHIEPPFLQSAIEQRNFVADTQQFALAADWQAHYSLTEGIDRTLETLLENGFVEKQSNGRKQGSR